MNLLLLPAGKINIKQFLIFSALILSISNLFAQQADFKATTAVAGCPPLTVRFQDTSTGTNSATTYSWDFDNGNSSVFKDADATFTTPGTYTIKHTVTNGPGSSDTEVKTHYVTVYAKPNVDFSVNKTSGCSPLAVEFTNLSLAGSGSIDSATWVFGDGGSSIDQATKVPHTYTISGDMTVSLTIRNEFGCKNGISKTGIIKVKGPEAESIPLVTTFCQVPATVTFPNTSSGAGTLHYSWNFDDGSQLSTEKEPTHTFTQAGTYDVTLNVSDEQGCTSSSTITINAGSEGGLSFSPKASKICIGQFVGFDVSTTTPAVSYEWNFGNGTTSDKANPTVAYDTGRTYTVKLTAQLQGKSCKSVVTKSIQVIPDAKPQFTYKSACDYTVTFTNTSTSSNKWFWEFGNGYGSQEKSPSFKYSASGSYNIKLIAYNELNCSKTLEQTILVSPRPVASFTPNKEQDCIEPSLSGCAPFTINFTNTSTPTNGFTSKWVFGDGTSSTDKNPTHTYAKGTYTVSLEVTNSANCTNKTTAKVTVSDVTPVAKFHTNKTSACTRQDITFIDDSQNATFWCWDFGDGSSAVGQQVTHSYVESGKYTVRLTAKNGGCSSVYEIVNAVEIKNPSVDFKIEKNCADPYNVTITNKSAGYTSLIWDFGDGKVSNSDTVRYHKYDTTGTFQLQLTTANSTTGCTSTLATTVAIYDVEADFKIDNPKPCKDAPVTFESTSQSVSSLQWVFGNGVTSTASKETTSFSNSGKFNVTLYAYDPDGCADFMVIPVEVLNMQGNFSFTAISTCSELTVDFQDQSSASPVIKNWAWDFGNGITSTVQHPQDIVFDKVDSAYTVTLTLTNNDGTCSFIKTNAVNFTIPDPEFLAVKHGYCLGESVTLSNQSLNASTYKWQFGNGEESQTYNGTIAYNQTGNYDITLFAKDVYGCEQSITKQAYISVTQPDANFLPSNTIGECPPLTSSFKDQSTGTIAKWAWDFGDGQRSTLDETVYNTYGRPGIYDVTLIVTDANGCRDTTIAENVITVGGPDGTFATAVPGPYCVNDSVAFTSTTVNAVIQRWDFGDGRVLDLTEAEPKHLYVAPGTFLLSLTLIDAKGCPVFAQGDVRISIADTTKADFTFSPCVFMNETFTLRAQPQQNDLLYEWDVNGTPAGSGATIEAIIDTLGNQRVMLKTINASGCASHITYEIPVQGDVLFVPNVFTPNADEFNNTFEIAGIERSTWNLYVYNRWGTQVYKQKDYKNTFNGGDLDSGVYYYLLENNLCPDRQYKGTISIIR